MRKIQLAFPSGGSKLSSTGVLPPLGILSLGTYLKRAMPELEVEVLDGELLGDRTIDLLDGDVLGISTTGANYYNGIVLARAAKRKGMRNVLGGPHATVKHEQILRRQLSVDAVIRGEGEKPFLDYLRAMGDIAALRTIKDLSFREGSEVVISERRAPCELPPLDTIPAPDYSLLGDFGRQYMYNFEDHPYTARDYTRFSSMESQKGCQKSVDKGRCTFCARIDKGLRRLEPEEFWQRVEASADQWGKTMIWDYSDSFTGARDDWLLRVAYERPPHLNNVYLKIFARADELDEVTVDLLRHVRVREVFVGFESGDQQKLESVNKGTTLEQNLAAVHNLRRANIETYGSFIYGMPGEDARSLELTLRHAEDLMSVGQLSAMGIRCFFPLAGMPDYQRLVNKLRKDGCSALADELVECDAFDPVDLQRLWLHHMTNTSYEEIRHYHFRLMDAAHRHDVRINGPERLLLL
jgi:anaerobic magnesium-protoporphyrin IX monomethyl ester cyclase